MEFPHYHSFLRYLRRRLLAGLKVTVRRMSFAPPEHDGECQRRRGRYHIRIKKHLPEYYAIDVLMHETAHVLSWATEKDLHGPLWGRAYSTVYRTFLEWRAID